MAAVRTDMAAIKTDMAAIRTDMCAIKTDIAAIKTDVATMKMRLVTVEIITKVAENARRDDGTRRPYHIIPDVDGRDPVRDENLTALYNIKAIKALSREEVTQYLSFYAPAGDEPLASTFDAKLQYIANKVGCTVDLFP
ncbi:hypothetical protein NEOLEDRAFT_1184843 [Neolentinus lepideus HHB14362 ss-1]|uniref:Mug135-like C-terminal domain-containing protein n=1 Tax=Neolentinus lepideus HHB14362 ss-1 TaxID=1314782 RepID=A0A165LTD6_9AGAM|nr:hypothetical protein NEOLEDRAFT_1184843 [Neolentinus lepideus HHB14362 ss-1]